MAGLFIVRQARGPTWDPSRGRRAQAGWDEHAAFINRLSENGEIPLGGPIGDVDGRHVVLIVRAGSEPEIHAMFAEDPWMDTILQIESVEPWTLWIGSEKIAAF